MGDPEIASCPPAVSYYWGLMRWCLACITVIVPFLRDKVPNMYLYVCRLRGDVCERAGAWPCICSPDDPWRNYFGWQVGWEKLARSSPFLKYLRLSEFAVCQCEIPFVLCS